MPLTHRSVLVEFTDSRNPISEPGLVSISYPQLKLSLIFIIFVYFLPSLVAVATSGPYKFWGNQLRGAGCVGRSNFPIFRRLERSSLQHSGTTMSL